MKTVDTHQLYPQLPPIFCIVSPKYWTPYSQLKIFGTFYSLDIFQVGYLFTGISCLKLEKKKKKLYVKEPETLCKRQRRKTAANHLSENISSHYSRYWQNYCAGMKNRQEIHQPVTDVLPVCQISLFQIELLFLPQFHKKRANLEIVWCCRFILN